MAPFGAIFFMARVGAIIYGPSWGHDLGPLLVPEFMYPLGALIYGPSWGHNLWSLLGP